jgi:hypothetical protein
MDANTQNTILGAVALAVSVGGGILTAINHKRVRSNCCGARAEASLDIENTTPPELTIKSPPTK